MTLLQPYPYQIKGAQWLASKSQALLADWMGLGKSAQAVHACDLVGAKRILVICPASVRANWKREFFRFSPLDRPITVMMPGDSTIPISGVLVMSYDMAANPAIRKRLMEQPWDVLVLDEAHFLKERSAKRTKAVYGHAGYPGIAHKAKHVWRLTGTPAPNDASELYTQLTSGGVIDKVPYWDFVFTYCAGFNHDYGYKITGHKNVEQLKKIMAPFMLRRTLKDVDMELPKLRYQEVIVPRSDVELDPHFYEAVKAAGGEDSFMEELRVADQTLRTALASVDLSYTGSDKDKLGILAGLAPSNSSLRRYIALAKLPACLDIIEEDLKYDSHHKVVIFAIHQAVIEETRARFAKYGAVTLYGKTPADKRQQNLEKFKTNPKCRVFIGNIQAAGVGIDGLQEAACHVEMIEQDWVPSNNAQAIMRVHRNGQRNPVRVRVFQLEDSVDEDIQVTVTRKARELMRIF